MNDNELLDQARRQSLSAAEYKPTDLHIDRENGLDIHWADDQKSHYSLSYLRKRCPCATCRIDREKAPDQPVARGGSLSLNVLPAGIDKATQFANARIVGNYALQIDWSDGHKSGIYDFRYLRMICPDSGPARKQS